MDTLHNKAPIIIVRKKSKGHDGHHGGAWKVAYADFVTAMMALFIVLWLMNSDEKTKQAVAGYFKDPKGLSKEIGSGAGKGGEGIEVRTGDMARLKERLEAVLKQAPELSAALEKQVEMTVTGEGLRIELLETENGTFFETGIAKPTDNGKRLLTSVAGELSKLRNPLTIEGHTDSKPYSRAGDYSNWELSTDRANAARRLMIAAGFDHARVTQVRGFADQRLRHPDNPLAASNRRVSLVVEYLPRSPAAEPAPPQH